MERRVDCRTKTYVSPLSLYYLSDDKADIHSVQSSFTHRRGEDIYDHRFHRSTSSCGEQSVKGVVKVMEIRWMNSDMNRLSGVDKGRRRR